MKVIFGNQSYCFRPWKPELGKVFSHGFSFDSETTLIDNERPWIAPAYVIGAAYGITADSGRAEGYFIRRNDVANFFDVHRDQLVVAHNASFDLAVVHTLAPELDIYSWVERNWVWDTQLLHKLLALGKEGHVAGGKDESTLETCIQKYLGIELPKDVTDSTGRPVRLSYARWLQTAPSEIEPIYLEYLAKDVITTYQLFRELRRLHTNTLHAAADTWGFVSPQWLDQQIRRWGFQTHHIQLRAKIVLDKVTGNGLHLDLSRRDILAGVLETIVAEKKQQLSAFGYLPGKGSGKALQAIFTRLERDNPELSFPKTDTGKYSTAHDSIQELAEQLPFAKLYCEYGEVEKLRGTFINKMVKPVLHPSFNVMTRSGRASSFGEINSQNLPTDDRIRSCFVPSPGHVFIDADYKTVELATLAQACIGQFGLASGMAQAINAGQDLHTLVAARVTGKPESQITKAERENAKPINFGKPGGMANNTLKQYAKVNYGVHSAISTRRPSVKLKRAVMGLVGRAGVFTFTGRLRANAQYCARHNTVFQDLAADGMKLALWSLLRAGYRIVNVVHDQVLVEVPVNSNLKYHAERIRELMIAGMKLVVPDVNIDVTYAATERWHKDAEALFDEGRTSLLITDRQHLLVAVTTLAGDEGHILVCDRGWMPLSTLDPYEEVGERNNSRGWTVKFEYSTSAGAAMRCLRLSYGDKRKIVAAILNRFMGKWENDRNNAGRQRYL